MPRLPESNSPKLGIGALIAALTLLFVGSVGWFAFLYVRGVQKDSLDMEFAKALLQVGVVSVVATVLSLLVFGYQHRMERDQRERERRLDLQHQEDEAARHRLQTQSKFLKGTLSRIAESYSNTKRARRRLRALGLRYTADGAFVSVDRYDECMAEINDAQLDLEIIKSDVKTSHDEFRSGDEPAASLRKMETYLGELIEEYEISRARVGATTGEIPLSSLPRLNAFVERSPDSQFLVDFSDAHSTARAAVRAELNGLGLSRK